MYPLAVHQLNDALAYIDAHADELGVDPNQIVLAGDSAGGQLASQMATLMTSPDYADIMGITPALAMMPTTTPTSTSETGSSRPERCERA